MSRAADDEALRVSAIVPTWNEEMWVSRILRCLTAHEAVLEIIVADNFSQDRTRQVAAKFGAKIVPGGRPATGRNRAAAEATSPLLLFADADALISNEVIDHALRLFSTQRNVVLVHYRSSAIGASALEATVYSTMHIYLRALQWMGIAQGVGTLIVMRRSAFERLGRFDETLTVAEDADLIRRASSFGVVKYEAEPVVWTSARRLRREGFVCFAGKNMLWALLRLLKVRASILPYTWRPYSPALALRDADEVGDTDLLNDTLGHV